MIWKLDLSLCPTDIIYSMEMPRSARPLSVANQNGRPVMWVSFDSGRDETEYRKVLVSLTGTKTPLLPIHVGTIQLDGGIVLHVSVSEHEAVL